MSPQRRHGDASGNPRRAERAPGHRAGRAPGSGRSRSSAGRVAAVIVLVLSAGLVGVDLVRSDADDQHRIGAAVARTGRPSAGSQDGSRASVAGPPTTGAEPPASTAGPQAGAGRDAAKGGLPLREGSATFHGARRQGRIAGISGPLLRYAVATEAGSGIDSDAFALAVDAILGDARSWTASRQLRLRLVPAGTPADFTIYLASPATSERMCRQDGLETHQYTNCRLSSGKVVINLARWQHATPDYGAPVSVYQAYAINHEVGHQLGWWHESCPKRGQPAPVMQQQTLGLHGCLANPWPYLNGKKYSGPTAPR